MRAPLHVIAKRNCATRYPNEEPRCGVFDRSRRRLLESRQHALDLLATRFEKVWQFQVAAKGLDRLGVRESGENGRDLEQNAAGFAEVDRAEILAVLLFGWVPTMGADQFLGHLRLLCVVRSAEGNVVYRTAPLMPAHHCGGFIDVDHAAFRIARRSEADHRSFPSDLAEPEYVGQDRRGLLRAVEKQRHPLQTADRMFGGNVVVAPGPLVLGIADTDERKRHAIRVRER